MILCVIPNEVRNPSGVERQEQVRFLTRNSILAPHIPAAPKTGD